MDADSEIVLTLFPNFFVELLTDRMFYESLFIILRKQLHQDLSLQIAKILTKISTSRTSILEDSEMSDSKEVFKNYVINGLFVVFENSP